MTLFKVASEWSTLRTKGQVACAAIRASQRHRLQRDDVFTAVALLSEKPGAWDGVVLQGLESLCTAGGTDAWPAATLADLSTLLVRKRRTCPDRLRPVLQHVYLPLLRHSTAGLQGAATAQPLPLQDLLRVALNNILLEVSETANTSADILDMLFTPQPEAPTLPHRHHHPADLQKAFVGFLHGATRGMRHSHNHGVGSREQAAALGEMVSRATVDPALLGWESCLCYAEALGDMRFPSDDAVPRVIRHAFRNGWGAAAGGIGYADAAVLLSAVGTTVRSTIIRRQYGNLLCRVVATRHGGGAGWVGPRAAPLDARDIPALLRGTHLCGCTERHFGLLAGVLQGTPQADVSQRLTHAQLRWVVTACAAAEHPSKPAFMVWLHGVLLQRGFAAWDAASLVRLAVCFARAGLPDEAGPLVSEALRRELWWSRLSPQLLTTLSGCLSRFGSGERDALVAGVLSRLASFSEEGGLGWACASHGVYILNALHCLRAHRCMREFAPQLPGVLEALLRAPCPEQVLLLRIRIVHIYVHDYRLPRGILKGLGRKAPPSRSSSSSAEVTAEPELQSGGGPPKGVQRGIMRRAVRLAEGAGCAARHFSSLSAPQWVDALRQAQKDDLKTSVSYDIKIDDELMFKETHHRFDDTVFRGITHAHRSALCNGDPDKPYVCIGSAFAFPDWQDNPVVNEPDQPAQLWWDPASPTEKVMVQLGPHIPPALWIPIKPTHEAMKRLFRDFTSVDAMQLERYMQKYEEAQTAFEEKSSEKLVDNANVRAMDHFRDQLRFRNVDELRKDYPLSVTLFAGTMDHASSVEKSIIAGAPQNPFFFSWPLLQASQEDVNTAKFSAFRSVYSKAMVVFITRMDLAPDNEHPEGITACNECPVFAHIVYPDMPRLSGGRSVIRKFNEGFGSELPEDIPVDVAAGLRDFQPRGVLRLEQQFSRMVEAVPRGMLHDRHHANALATSLIALAGVGDPRLAEKAEILAKRSEHQLRLAAATSLAMADDLEGFNALLSAEQHEGVAQAMQRHLERMGSLRGPFELGEHTLETASIITNPTFDADSPEELEAAQRLKQQQGQEPFN